MDLAASVVREWRIDQFVVPYGTFLDWEWSSFPRLVMLHTCSVWIASFLFNSIKTNYMYFACYKAWHQWELPICSEQWIWMLCILQLFLNPDFYQYTDILSVHIFRVKKALKDQLAHKDCKACQSKGTRYCIWGIQWERRTSIIIFIPCSLYMHIYELYSP